MTKKRKLTYSKIEKTISYLIIALLATITGVLGILATQDAPLYAFLFIAFFVATVMVIIFASLRQHDRLFTFFDDIWGRFF